MKNNDISDEAVKKATGKTWPQWLKLLDAAGCRTMTHREIVAIIAKKFDVGAWWQQMVTVGYERARGLRVKHQTAGGFSVNISRTLPIAAEVLSGAWTTHRVASKWINVKSFAITKATAGRSVRLKWLNDDSRVNVMLYPKGKSKTQMSIEHGKLKSAAAVVKMRKFWALKIERMSETISRS